MRDGKTREGKTREADMREDPTLDHAVGFFFCFLFRFSSQSADESMD